MAEQNYFPEGMLSATAENKEFISSVAGLERAILQDRILEARTILCDSGHNLIVDLGGVRGIIERSETAIGISDGSVRDIAIITRVNKPVCFKVQQLVHDPNGQAIAFLSRAQAQRECIEKKISKLQPGDIVDGRVTHLEPFGCFVDIGCGVIAMITIDNISVSRISHPRDRFFAGQYIKAVVKDIDKETGRINLSHKELLGTWEQNAAFFEAGQTAAGIVRSVESYGVFVELTPNLAGLAEWKEGIVPGQQTAVFIKNIIPQKMKLKLIIIDSFDGEFVREKPQYFIEEGHIDRWRYSPPSCERLVETLFTMDDRFYAGAV
ncbi:MAG: 30S ribosomal protein S1 [Ruminococcaceae bacterium]|nr:30S ribosomal protein S1 [Oscillospiraceae bacterium]